MFLIRSAGIQDIGRLQTLFLQLGYHTKRETVEARLKEAEGRDGILVAESGSVVRGVVVIHFMTPVHEEGRWAVISALVIDEACRGEGLGQALLAEAERLSRQQGCTQIELSSSERRTRAHKFYEDNGYHEVRKRFIKPLAAP
ncbi:GNAT family N-acetyltransferase [Chimaeribacter arupi]|uniref:GNAT family N-acetyltransferase n=1 Tax=Chimaeribacter arupi TaxID=2060066 RepID=A0A2N5END4_9GAMM|nr:GNAT family N-acetyltransferase [Chimaeribacter arupi]PLR31407.1 GNAT family N-acetyltransferase [Chimaeribacter arupi]PLR50192.1 GNAT family N-acetyltransferase [Chimaeribacter arupi]